MNTPCAAVDLTRLERNLATMSAIAGRHSVKLRPHMKTAKCLEVARLAADAHSAGVTVSTPREAEYFASGGFKDVLYAVCAVPDKVASLATLCRSHPELAITLVVDDANIVPELDAAAAGLPFEVLIEIDSGERRSGVAPQGSQLLGVAAALRDSSSLRLAGVLTHGGHSYDASSRQQIEAIAEDERVAVVTAAARLRDRGYDIATVSLGSTPTCLLGQRFDGITEIRPGVYMFHDLVQVELGCCTLDDLALSVVSTVISHQPSHGRIIIDAGALALSKDLGVRGYRDGIGYGRVCTLADARPIADLHVARVDQEHGYVDGSIDFSVVPVGSKLRVLPNHACMTAAPYARFAVHRDGNLQGYWSRASAW